MKANRQSPVRVMTAAFVAVLARYSGQRDIVVMLPRSIRPEGAQVRRRRRRRGLTSGGLGSRQRCHSTSSVAGGGAL